MRALVCCAVGAALILVLAGTAGAVPVEVGYVDAPQCDTLVVPQFVDELGLGAASGGPFPLDEEIITSSQPTPLSSCPSTDAGSGSFLVTMTNLTPFDFAEVWYVADGLDTTISNFDGDASTLGFGCCLGKAFRIDMVGANTPLVFESFLPNGIFESGETWEFIIQDYTNGPGLPPDFFLSPGLVGDDSVFGEPVPTSSGSIIAVRAPEPSALLLVGLGLAGVAAMRRQRSRQG